MTTYSAPVSARSRLAMFAVILIAATAGALVSISPIAALAAASGSAALLLIASGRGAVTVFLAALGGLLVGYAFMSRGFAYLGVPPLFVGEIVLALGAFALLAALPTRRPGLMQLLLVAFMAWGALRTIPFLPSEGLEALRDSAVWVYAGFGLILSLVLRPHHARRLLDLYGTVLPVFVLWVPLFGLLWHAYQELIPRVPVAGIPVAFLKPGDLAVHLAGVAAFILAGLYSRRGWRRAAEPLLWTVWLVGVAVVASLNRGGMLAVSTVASLMIFVRSLGRWATALMVALLVVGMVGLLNLKFDTGLNRSVSVEQLLANVESVFVESDDPALSASREWREDWWNTIVDYTFNGPYFWGGKGYGINLANADGFQVGDGSLRAPHNAHLNLLARGGVPGLGLWIAVQAAFAVTMLRAGAAAARSGRRIWLGVIGWVFVYWLAALVNMTFDVYLEGPQGGIWFWCIMGFGLAAASMIRETKEDLAVASSDDDPHPADARATARPHAT